jgi:hypothetical protein
MHELAPCIIRHRGRRGNKRSYVLYRLEARISSFSSSSPEPFEVSSQGRRRVALALLVSLCDYGFSIIEQP